MRPALILASVLASCGPSRCDPPSIGDEVGDVEIRYSHRVGGDGWIVESVDGCMVTLVRGSQSFAVNWQDVVRFRVP